MYTIISKVDLADRICKYVFLAPQIAKKAKPGQFVMIRVDDEGERIPLTVADTDPEKGTVTIVVQAVGTTTKKLHCKNEGESINDLVGPLGTPTHLDGHKNAVCVAGGVGIAEIHPIARGLKEAGANVTSIIGSRNHDLLFFEDEMKKASNELIVTTDDGSYGIHGLVLKPLQEMMDTGKQIDIVFCVGPVIMMREVAKATKPFGIPTFVSLNPLMVDGTGMCGACRVTVGGETKFACVDGPDFNAHDVDFDELMGRLVAFKNDEGISLKHWEDHVCKNPGGCTCHEK
ncbi:MAG: sulfide/dihydroorotate dehydrogenase-like FAD/NAD-binding protein [Caldisericia bacterium]